MNFHREIEIKTFYIFDKIKRNVTLTTMKELNVDNFHRIFCKIKI